MVRSMIKINILNKNIVNSRARFFRKRDKGTIWEMPAAPKVNSSCISMPRNKFGVRKVNAREVVVVERRREKRTRNEASADGRLDLCQVCSP